MAAFFVAMSFLKSPYWAAKLRLMETLVVPTHLEGAAS